MQIIHSNAIGMSRSITRDAGAGTGMVLVLCAAACLVSVKLQ